MSGIYGAIALESAAAEERWRVALTRMNDTLQSLDSALEVGQRSDAWPRGMAVVTPSRSPLVSRFVENESGEALLYLGDGRCNEALIRKVLATRDYAALEGFFVAVRLEGTAPGKVRRCTLVRDRSGSFSVVYQVVDGVLHFAPRVSALQLQSASTDDLDPVGLGFLLSSGFMPGSATQLKSIACVEPGTAVDIEANGTCSVHRYWRYPASLKGAVPDTGALLDQAVSLFESAIAANYDDKRQTVVFLSGGVDSRAILSACVAHAGDATQVHTVSWGEQGSESVSGTDTFVARAIAQKLGTRHRFLEKHSLDYGNEFETACRLSDWASETAAMQPVEWQLMASLANDGFTACLRGDQVFSASRAVQGPSDAKSMARLCRLSRQTLAGTLLRPKIYRHWSESTDAFLQSMETPAGYSSNDLRDLYRFEHQVPNEQQSAALYKSVYLDHRNPILDDSFLEVLPLTREEDRANRKLFCQITARLAADLADIPFAEQHSDPDSRQFFIEGGVAHGYLLEALDDTSSPVYDLFDRDALVRLVSTNSSVVPVLTGARSRWKAARAVALKAITRVSPRMAGTLSHHARASSLPWDKAIRRFLVIKHFVDSHAGL